MKEIIKISVPKERIRQKVKQVNGNKWSYRVVLPVEAKKYKSHILLISEDFCKQDPNIDNNMDLFFYSDQDINLSRAIRKADGKTVYNSVKVKPKDLYECFYGQYKEPSKRYTEEEIKFISENVPVLDFLEQHAGLSFQKTGQNYYRCDQHNSLVLDIKKNVIHWNSMNCHGSAITYLEKIDNMSFPEAMRTLESFHAELPTEKKVYHPPVHEQLEFILPEAALNQNKIYAYLCGERKIDKSLVKRFVDEGKIYLDNKNNCVFKCENYKGQVDAAFRRSTYSGWRGDVGGGNKFTGFYIEMDPNAKKLVMTEAYIDGLSYITMKKLQGKPIDFNVLCSDSATVMKETFRINYLTRSNINQNIDTLIIASDNDKGGLNAVEDMKEFIKPFNRIKNIDTDLPALDSDWNKDLQLFATKTNELEKKTPIKIL